MENVPLFDLRAALPLLLPKAIAWADAQEKDALSRGRQLTPSELRIARAVEVMQPERVRVIVAPSLPLPADPEFRVPRRGSVNPSPLGDGQVGWIYHQADEGLQEQQPRSLGL